MLRTWDELKEFVVVQGLVDADSTSDEDVTRVAITQEGIQVLAILANVAFDESSIGLQSMIDSMYANPEWRPALEKVDETR